MKKQVLKNQSKNYPSLQGGLSLIELLISMVIGLFLLGGVVTNLVGTKNSDRMRAAISEMDDSARTAFSTMRQSIQHAGYPSIHSKLIGKSFFTEADGTIENPNCSDGQARDLDDLLADEDRQTRDRSRGDVITVIALADNPCATGNDSCPDIADINPEAQVYSDCMGAGLNRDAHVVACSADKAEDPFSASSRIYSTFHLGGGNNSRTLYCVGNRGGSQPLADNIEAMQILYGIRIGDDGNVRYRNADDVDDDDQWGMVASVQIALLLRSSKDVLKTESTKTQYTLLDSQRDIATADLRRLFRVYTTTINLANQNKGGILL